MTYYLSTIRHLTLAQIWHRGHRVVRRRWWRFNGKQSPAITSCNPATHIPLYQGLSDLISDTEAATGEVAASLKRAQAISGNRFCFLNQTVTFGDRVRWNDPELSQLWRYHLHYFDYVRDLLIWSAAGKNDLAYPVFRKLAFSWIDNNQTLKGDGWHPYTISLRVVNWIHALSGFAKQFAADREAADIILRNVFGQVQVLFSDLELDVRGNHLLENLRALIWAGVAFDGAESHRWFERGLQLLEVEVSEQILSDGGHFERSPGYHVVVFKDLLEIAVWLKRNTDSTPLWLSAALRRMADYLWKVMLPDGNVPLLKDTVWDNWPAPADLLTATGIFLNEPRYKFHPHYGLYPELLFGGEGRGRIEGWATNDERRVSVALPATGHYVIRDDDSGDYLILDAGKTCPDYLPAHAHADTLTYELISAGQRVVVDSGVYEYRAGPWRDYFRSTRAHNTVEVAGENQSEVWGSFRVGRRARPGPVVWQPGEKHTLVQGEHDGYQRLAVPVIHQRTVVYQQFWLIVDQLWGNGATTAHNHVHLNPQLSFEKVDASTWRVNNGGIQLWFKSFGNKESLIIEGQKEPFLQGWYSEKFGELRTNSVLRLTQTGSLPFCYGYVISRDAPVDLYAMQVSGGHEINLGFHGRSYSLRLVRTEAPRFT